MSSGDLQLVLQFLAVGASIATVIFSVNRYVAESRAKRDFDERELRWKQFQFAKELIDDLRAASQFDSVSKLVDFFRAEYVLPDGSSTSIDRRDTIRGLRVTDMELDNKDLFVRMSIDVVLTHFDRLQSCIDQNFIVEADITNDIIYVCHSLRSDQALIQALEAYCGLFLYQRAFRFVSGMGTVDCR